MDLAKYNVELRSRCRLYGSIHIKLKNKQKLIFGVKTGAVVTLDSARWPRSLDLGAVHKVIDETVKSINLYTWDLQTSIPMYTSMQYINTNCKN